MARGRVRPAGGRAGALLASLALALWGCSHLPLWPRAVASCPGELRSTRDIAGDRRLELRYAIRAGQVDTAFRLAVEKRGDKLTLVGLSPLGAQLFSVVQTGTDLDVEALPASVLDVPPENVLRDLHRVLFLGVPSVPAEGEVATVRGDVRISETWRDARLVRRRFERLDGSPAGAVAIEFVERPAEGLAEARIDNGGCGYRATLVTLVRSE